MLLRSAAAAARAWLRASRASLRLSWRAGREFVLKVANPFHLRKYAALAACAAPYAVVFACNELVVKRYRHLRRRRREEEMSVACLDRELVQGVLFALRSACESVEVTNGAGERVSVAVPGELIEDVATVFCGTRDIAQCVFELLVSSLRELETHLDFWTRQQRMLSRRRQRTLFLLLRRGPVSFVRDLLSLFGIHPNRELSQGAHSADVISKRVLTLHVVRRGLAEAIAATHAAACKLHRVRGAGAPGPRAGPLAVDIAEDRELLARLPFTVLDAAFDALVDVHAVVLAVLRLAERCDALGGTPAALVRVDPDLLELSAAACVTRRASARGDELSATSSILIHPSPGGGGGGDSLRRKQSTSLSSLSELALCQAKSEEARSLMAAVRATLRARARHVWGGSHDGVAVVLEAPAWARRLTPQEEWWILNTVQALVLWKATRFVVLHSPLGGSRDFEDWAVAGVGTARRSLGRNVVAPFQSLRQKLFMRGESKMGDVTPEKVQLELDTLEDMIRHFVGRHAGGAGGDGGMRAVMETYERDIRRPVAGIASGRLLNEMLIQVQQMKAESSLLLCEIDKILSTNELTIAMMAAVPAILLMASVLRVAWRAVTPSPPDPRAETMETRTEIIKLKIHLIAAAHGAEAAPGGAEAARSAAGRDTGLALYRASEVNRAVSRVYRHHAGYRDYLVNMSGDGELASLRDAMRALFGPVSNGERLALVETIMDSFIVFR